MNFDDLKMHIFKLKQIQIENQKLLFENKNELKNELANLNFEENLEQVNKLRELITNCKNNLARINFELDYSEKLYDCLNSIYKAKNNDLIYDVNFWEKSTL